ncbi:hypothetical protein BJV78DRAFT_1351158 [Lactifluus subvellereus]|nr:hypothetical protein BJV78DRAFT_1351158 [Lactifluus subvellereus]
MPQEPSHFHEGMHWMAYTKFRVKRERNVMAAVLVAGPWVAVLTSYFHGTSRLSSFHGELSRLVSSRSINHLLWALALRVSAAGLVASPGQGVTRGCHMAPGFLFMNRSPACRGFPPPLPRIKIHEWCKSSPGCHVPRGPEAYSVLEASEGRTIGRDTGSRVPQWQLLKGKTREEGCVPGKWQREEYVLLSGSCRVACRGSSSDAQNR